MQHALVIGGSVAGLVAARVLCDHFARVTVLEKDSLEGGAHFRKGVPHGRQPHILLLRGQRILEELFPGFVADLQQAGAVTLNMGLDFEWFSNGQCRPRYRSAILSTACTRPLLESILRQRVTTLPQVVVRQETTVVALAVDDGAGARVNGVYCAQRGQEERERLAADLVVDASGRFSRAPDWLQAHGFNPPEETVVDGFPGYAMRLCRRPSGFAEPWKGLYIQPTPPHGTRGAIINPVEDDCWQVLMIGMAQDYPPTDEAGYLAFAHSLPSLKAYQALRTAEPLGPIWGFRRAENCLRHYERLPRHLERFLVLGDAVCALNPVYGQGMSVAALGAKTLDNCLRQQHRKAPGESLMGLARRFQQQLARVVRGPFDLATGEDRRWPVTAGNGATAPQGALTRLAQRYVDRLLWATTRSPRLTEAFYRVQQMIAPPTHLFRPDIVLQVLAAGRKQQEPGSGRWRVAGADAPPKL